MSTTLEILVPYLPFGILVENTDPGFFIGDRHILRGIDTQDEYPILVGSGESNDIQFKCCACLPVLRSFADLCTPLEDGTVPAVEVGRIDRDFTISSAKLIAQAGDYMIIELREDCNTKSAGFIFPEDIADKRISLAAADLLRSLHFAVGLTADQYIRKQS